MKQDIGDFNNRLETVDREICDLLAETIDRRLPEADAKIWHSHPVWFRDGNPTAGYSRQKRGTRLMFWSGAGFDEPSLDVLGEKFNPGGHLKLPHPWPGQTPPPEASRTVDVYTLRERPATRAAASLSRQLLPSNFSRCA